jgi:hypothetical protein
MVLVLVSKYSLISWSGEASVREDAVDRFLYPGFSLFVPCDLYPDFLRKGRRGSLGWHRHHIVSVVRFSPSPVPVLVSFRRVLDRED